MFTTFPEKYSDPGPEIIPSLWGLMMLMAKPYNKSVKVQSELANTPYFTSMVKVGTVLPYESDNRPFANHRSLGLFLFGIKLLSEGSRSQQATR